MPFCAHTLKDQPQKKWEPLFTPFGEANNECQRHTCQKCANLEPQHGHLNKVAYHTAKFAAEMFPANSEESKSAHQWGYLTGLWHDLGKFAPEWQSYLKTASDPHSDEILQRIDHTTAGAKHAVAKSPLGHFIATAIAGHHAGLLDSRHETHASLAKRLAKSFGKEIPEIDPPAEITDYPIPSLPAFLKQQNPDFSAAFFQRILFSCLVDADFLATAAFMNPVQAAQRPPSASGSFAHALELLDAKIANFGKPTPDDQVATARATVVTDCTQAAASSPGIFTLTVPTGGGKTLSSLNFALRHAITHGKHRIIYVIPFTSIIEQNAAVFRALLAPLGDNIIIEHHSNLSPDQEKNQTETSRLATENWDAPIIVTTAVQFYESLYAARTSRSRKLHHIANSVVILDEAQCLPVHYLKPCLRVLEEVSTHYHTRTILQRAARDHGEKSAERSHALSRTADFLATRISAATRTTSLDSLRGIEGEAAAAYFATFNQLISSDEPAFTLNGRSKRPPLDRTNALLSFLYVLLAHDCRSACETVGLDPQSGFLHQPRPGRHSLALDLMEEFRPLFADRLALSLINRRQIRPDDFDIQASGAVFLKPDSRKKVLAAWQERKQETFHHPFIDEKITYGLLPQIQARLLARHLRGDHDAYPAFLAR